MAHLSKPYSKLELKPEELRKLGYAVIDEMVDHYTRLPDKSVAHTRTRPEMETLLREPIPTHPTAPEVVLQQAIRDVFGNVIHNEHPRFFAFVPGPSNAVSAIADMLASGYNAFAGTWMESSGPAMIELLTIDWLRELVGLPEGAGGIFTSGGSMANLSALHTARYHAFGTNDALGVVYYSDQTHSSIDRATRVLGLQDGQIRRLPSNDNFQLDVDALRDAIAQDRAAGLVPFCVIANAGTTNTGTIDPLPAIADVCAQEGLWMHVDAAYGGALTLTQTGKTLLAGIERADSVTVDPHKWMFQPYEMGCLLVRDRHYLREAFLLVPEYLKDTERGEEEVNFYDYGVQLTRGFRALKLWMSLKVFGLTAFSEAIEWGIEQAEIAGELLRRNPRWQMVTAPHIGVLNFRYVPQGDWRDDEIDTLQQDVVNAIVASGYAMIATTILKGHKVIRLILINPRTTEEDIQGTVDALTAFAEQFTHAHEAASVNA